MKKSIILACACAFILASCRAGDTTSSRTPKGNVNAAVLVEEFIDFQCPACRAAHGQITQPLIEKYGNQIRFEIKHFPLRSIHPYALDAAEMSECAADQGKFWEFVDYDYANQQDLHINTLVPWAEAIGLETTLAERCWKSHSKRSIVLSDYKEGRERGVSGTPTFFVNGTQVKAGMDTLSEAIDAALRGTIMRL